MSRGDAYGHATAAASVRHGSETSLELAAHLSHANERHRIPRAMVARVLVLHLTSFVSNRGGIGKSSLVSQLAPAVARAAPDRVVLVLDLSIQGDASVFLLGGVREPAAAESAARTRGGEALAALGSDKGATAFLAAVTAVPAPARPASTSFWRGVYNNTPAPPTA